MCKIILKHCLTWEATFDVIRACPPTAGEFMGKRRAKNMEDREVVNYNDEHY